ncbi:hypothetical protein AKJ16_DCAP23639 [Drosera capensis]
MTFEFKGGSSLSSSHTGARSPIYTPSMLSCTVRDSPLHSIQTITDSFSPSPKSLHRFASSHFWLGAFAN